jgi:N-formylmaleamate deformylase
MSSWGSNDIEANGIHLHYTRTGGAKPPLVLAHGFSDDGLCWTPVVEELAATYDVIMVDARGHGRSEAPEQGYGPIEQADDLAGVIAGLGLQRPIILGHSMGAITTLTLAGRYPELPCAIALEDPPPWWAGGVETPFNEQWQAQSRAWITGLQRQTHEQIIAAQRAAEPNWPEADLAPWADSKLRLHLNFFNNRGGPLGINWPALLQRLVCPVLLIRADPERGGLVTEEAASALQTLVPHLRTVHISGAGHSIRRDQLRRYIDAVYPLFTEVTATCL